MACLSIVKAVLARGMFVIHSFVAVWKVVDVKGGNTAYWFLLTGILLLIFEGIVSVCGRDGKELKWFCPSVFLYLCSIVPPLWLLELDLAKEKWSTKRNSTSQQISEERLSQILDFEIAIYLPRQQWAEVLEQLLLVILIVGRWLLPKGEITREQLSQLLLAYLGLSADIIELFEAFDWQEVIENIELTYIILGIWSWSLLQFTLVLTASRARKPRLGMESPRSNSLDGPSCEEWADMDIIAIVCTVILQDGPFLLLRLVLIFRYKVVSYMNIFFTCKNTLVTILQLYRLFVLCCERRGIREAISVEWNSDPASAESSGCATSADHTSSRCSPTYTEVSENPTTETRYGTDRQSPAAGKRMPISPPADRQAQKRNLLRLLEDLKRSDHHLKQRYQQEGKRATWRSRVQETSRVAALASGYALSSSESELSVLRRADGEPAAESDDSQRSATGPSDINDDCVTVRSLTDSRSRQHLRALSVQCLNEIDSMSMSSVSQCEARSVRSRRERVSNPARIQTGYVRHLDRACKDHISSHRTPSPSPSISHSPPMKSVSFFRAGSGNRTRPPAIQIQPPSEHGSTELTSMYANANGEVACRSPSPARAMGLLRVLSKSRPSAWSGGSGRHRLERGRTDGERNSSALTRHESYV